MKKTTNNNTPIDKVVVIGASAGGVEALPMIINCLPIDFPWPVVITVHLLRSKESFLAEFMNKKSYLRVKEAESCDILTPGTVYLAPSNYHLLIEDDLRLTLSVDEPVNFSRPSIDVLFESAADAIGRDLIAIILTGANSDGAEGIRRVKELGGLTIVQDPKSAKMKAMPEQAIAATEIDHIIEIKEITPLLIRLAQKAGWRKKK